MDARFVATALGQVLIALSETVVMGHPGSDDPHRETLDLATSDGREFETTVKEIT